MHIPLPTHEVDCAALTAAVQHNCNIADARFARNHVMCIYLIKMREFYRWEHGVPLTAPLGLDLTNGLRSVIDK